jgi:hypothetical protein
MSREGPDSRISPIVIFCSRGMRAFGPDDDGAGNNRQDYDRVRPESNPDQFARVCVHRVQDNL